MRICSIASGSSGNCIYVGSDATHLLVDVGISGKRTEAGLKELGLTMMVCDGSFSELRSRNITLKYGKDNDVVVCASDLMAIGAMKALTEMDIFRPVCGFDGIILMGYVGKQMNTVRQNFAEISAMAMEELQRLMSGGKGRRVGTAYTLARMKYMDIIC